MRIHSASDIRTVDELVEFYILGPARNECFICTTYVEWIVEQLPVTLLGLLRSEKNKPSKYDLMIITAVSRELGKFNFDRNSNEVAILEEYKKRRITHVFNT